MKQKLWAEFFGTLFLIMIVVGSGIMGESLAQGNQAIVLLVNSLVTGAGLFVLIECLNPVSGAYFNPIVSFVSFLEKKKSFAHLLSYVFAQTAGAMIGILVTHLMFNQPLLQLAQKERIGFPIWLSEVVASFGLICTILLLKKAKSNKISLCVACYIMAGYWFTSSSAFANPAVTVVRMFTNTFCGIAANGVIPFIMAQFLGAFLALILIEKKMKIQISI